MSAVVLRVVGALVVVEVSDPRREVYLESGALVPDTAIASCVARLIGEGLIAEFAGKDDSEPEPEPVVEAIPVAGDAPGQDVRQDFESMNLDELRTYAGEHGVDLAGATRKADIIAAITAA